jgi:tRNA A-37 threonylcarbamoyl transferase component Bud32
MGIENLNNRSRARHTKFMQFVLSQVGITNNTGKPIKLLTRLGSRRSADGVVFDIGNGKVAKCIFIGRGAVNSIDSIKEEYKMAKLMSDAGAGPKVYGMKEFTLPSTLLNLKNQAGPLNWPNTPTMKRLLMNYFKHYGYKTKKAEKVVNTGIAQNPKNGINKSFSFNLFQSWWSVRNKEYKNVKKGAVIIMENLYSGPGVKTATTLYDYVVKEKHPMPLKEVTAAMKKMHSIKIAHQDLHTGNIMENLYSGPGVKTATTLRPMPLKEVAAVMKKMHSIKIAHQDLHAGNIMVQIKTDGSIRIVIIDFGRAKYPANKQTMNWNKNMVAEFAAYAGVRATNISAALPKSPMTMSSGTPPPFPAAPARLTLPLPASYGLMKAASGGYRIVGKRGPKKVNLTMEGLRYYAVNKGVPTDAIKKARTKKQLMNMIYAAKGGAAVAPKKSTPKVASSYGLVFNKGSVRMRGKKGGLVKPTKLTVAQLKAYAAKKGINLMGAKLKKNILQRLAK